MDETQQAITGYLEERAAEQLRFLIDLSNQNSFTGNKNGVDRVAGMIAERPGGDHLFF